MSKSSRVERESLGPVEVSTEAHVKLGLLDKRIGTAIVSAADEIIQGRLLDQFVLDVFQAGVGTSHNMNANEDLANRAIELVYRQKGEYNLVRSHDNVRMH
jgi:aspartate ammonia-lyase